MQTTVELTEEMAREINRLGKQFGFKDEKEFIEDAIREKLLQMKKKLFISATNEIKMGLERKGICSEEILEDFEKFRR